MKLPKISLSIIALITANLVPLGGVLFFGWEVGQVFLIYWCETLVVGVFNIFKMLLVRPGNIIDYLPKLILLPFFCVHFALFCLGYAWVIIDFFKMGEGVISIERILEEGQYRAWLFEIWRSYFESFKWALLALLISHGFSFVQNFLIKKEYASDSLIFLMFRPYKRLFLMHLVLFLGGVLSLHWGSPMAFLLVLILIKIALDVLQHQKEHGKAIGIFKPLIDRLNKKISETSLEKIN